MEEIEKYKWNTIGLECAPVFDKHYEIDFEKVQTLDDVNTILKLLKISVFANYQDIDSIMHLLKEVKS